MMRLFQDGGGNRQRRSKKLRLRFCFGQEFRVRKDSSEHRKVLFESEALLLLRQSRCAIGERYDAEALFIACSCGRFNTAVGQKAGYDQGLDPERARIKSRFVLAKVSRPRFPSMTMSPGCGVSESTISAPQLPRTKAFVSTTPFRMP